MPKEMGDNNVSSVKYWNNGIFTERIKINSVQDKSNYPLQKGQTKNTVGKNAFEPELCLEIKYDNEGDAREKLIFGQFNYDKDPVSGKKMKYKGWSKYNPVWSLLYTLLGKFQINDDDSIMPATLYKLSGKEFVTLRYCVGSQKDSDKPGFKDFNQFALANDQNEAELVTKFRELVSAGKIKSYDPNYFEDHKSRTQSTFDPNQMDQEKGNEEDETF